MYLRESKRSVRLAGAAREREFSLKRSSVYGGGFTGGFACSAREDSFASTVGSIGAGLAPVGLIAPTAGPTAGPLSPAAIWATNRTSTPASMMRARAAIELGRSDVTRCTARCYFPVAAVPLL